ncbi:MAG TPA: class A beta-lactamase [Bryobacteraceae bacterium]|jgi:beta-lactamase class A|nr:class A beta-lactamase [Bryobacteraceae bacterium]
MLAALLLFTAMLTALAGTSADLKPQFDQIERDSRGSLGLCAVLVRTGETIEFHADKSFPMQSVYKFPIGMSVLSDVDQGRLKLDQPVKISAADLVPASLHSPIRDQHPGGTELPLREVLRFMVSESDGTASDVLLKLTGGPEKVTAYLRGLGIEDVTVATSEAEMAKDNRAQYRNRSTPHGMAQLFREFQNGRGLSATSRALLLEFMTKTDTGPMRLKGMLPAGTTVAHKTGTSGTVKGMTAATNDAGLITLPNGEKLAVAVFVSDSKGDTGQRERAIASATRIAWDWFAGSK